MINHTKPSVMVRKAGNDDLPDILKLFEELSASAQTTLGAETAEIIFDKMMSYPDYSVYAAELDGAIVGAFELVVIDSLGHLGTPFGILEDVVVTASHRNLGIGGQLVRFAAEACRERGCYKMVLSSNVKRTDAHRFYKRLGFSLHGYSFALSL